VELTAEERDILAGKRGEAPKRALEYQMELGKFCGVRNSLHAGGVAGGH